MCVAACVYWDECSLDPCIYNFSCQKQQHIFFFLHMCFLLHRLSLLNNNQTLTWVLNELKQARKLRITQTRVGPFARSGWRLPKLTNLYRCIFSYYTVDKSTVLAPEALTVCPLQAETSYLQSPSRVLIWGRDSQAPQESAQLRPQDPSGQSFHPQTSKPAFSSITGSPYTRTVKRIALKPLYI